MLWRFLGDIITFFLVCIVVLYYFILPIVGLIVFGYSFFADDTPEVIETYRWGSFVILVGSILGWIKYPPVGGRKRS